MVFKTFIIAVGAASTVLSCNDTGEGNLGYGMAGGSKQRQKQPYNSGYQYGNANPQYPSAPSNVIGQNQVQSQTDPYGDNLGDFVEVDPNQANTIDRKLKIVSTYKGKGCSWHGASGGPANTVSDGQLTVTESSHEYNLTKINAVSGGQWQNIDEGIRGGVGKDLYTRVHVGDVFNYYKGQKESFDSLVYVNEVVNYRSKINNEPVKVTFSKMIPTNVRFGFRCDQFPSTIAYDTRITIVNSNDTRDAVMTVSRTDLGSGKCDINFNFEIPSDVSKGKIYERITIPRTAVYSYDENNSKYLSKIVSDSLRAGTRDSKSYRTRMTLKICKFEEEGSSEQSFSCDIPQNGCSI